MGEEESSSQLKFIATNKPGTSVEDRHSQKSEASSRTDAVFEATKTESQTYGTSDDEEDQEIQTFDLDKMSSTSSNKSTKLIELTLPELKQDGADIKRFLKRSKRPNTQQLIREKAECTAEREEQKRREAIFFYIPGEEDYDSKQDLTGDEKSKMDISASSTVACPFITETSSSIGLSKSNTESDKKNEE
ncbi:uncharacterized protein LOC126745763 [Anthonomus grandis grandis]|uniref:uncharacterized protein LOC126745763 n=1 Tax=Anthonomus grandis grandis TaxID=2921223 RepID=UPI0021650957|nr:uncharacterized protein LOC126745763 [Anthonomus grandis grandis]